MHRNRISVWLAALFGSWLLAGSVQGDDGHAVVLLVASDAVSSNRQDIETSVSHLVRRMAPNDRLAVVVYSELVERVLPLSTPDPAFSAQLAAVLDRLQFNGRVNGAVGFERALDELKQSSSGTLIVFSNLDVVTGDEALAQRFRDWLRINLVSQAASRGMRVLAVTDAQIETALRKQIVEYPGNRIVQTAQFRAQFQSLLNAYGASADGRLQTNDVQLADTPGSTPARTPLDLAASTVVVANDNALNGISAPIHNQTDRTIGGLIPSDPSSWLSIGSSLLLRTTVAILLIVLIVTAAVLLLRRRTRRRKSPFIRFSLPRFARSRNLDEDPYEVTANWDDDELQYALASDPTNRFDRSFEEVSAALEGISKAYRAQNENGAERRSPDLAPTVVLPNARAAKRKDLLPDCEATQLLPNARAAKRKDLLPDCEPTQLLPGARAARRTDSFDTDATEVLRRNKS